MRRVRRLIVATLVACAAASIPLTAAEGATTLGGYLMSSTAGPATLILEAPSAGIPADPTGELNLARTVARSEVGSGYALASIAWPGSTVANVPSVLSGQVNENVVANGGPPFFPTLPNYPVRAETFYPQGPETQNAGVEGAGMRASSVEGNSESYSSGGDVVFNGLVEARRVVSQSRSIASGAEAVSEATAALHDVEILGGLITAKMISNTVRTVSNGTNASVTGDFAIAGLSIGGDLPGIVDQEGEQVSIPITAISADGDGIHISGQDDPGPSRDQINEAGKALEDMGITLIAPKPIDSVVGAAASRAHDGLIVVIDFRTFQPYINMLPAAVLIELEERGIFADQTVILAIGSVAASTNAALLPEIPPPPVVPPVVPPPAVVAPPVSFPPPVAPPVVPPAVPGAPVINSVPVAAAIPLPVALAVMVGFIGFFGTWGLGKFADRATMPAAAATEHH